MTGFPDRRDPSGTIKPAAPWAEALRDELAGLSVLVTGHTGFKGSWLTLWLRELGASVTGFALDPPTVPNNYEASAVADALRADYRADLRDRDSARSGDPSEPTWTSSFIWRPRASSSRGSPNPPKRSP